MFNQKKVLTFQEIILKLQQYSTRGGKIFPNILIGQNALTQQSMEEIFNISNVNKELEIKQVSVNEFVVELDGETGWLVLSERFAHFPGWKAAINGNNFKIYKANNVISAVYLNGERGTLTFRYYPDSFRKGKTITSITVLILLLLAIYAIYTKLKNDKNRP